MRLASDTGAKSNYVFAALHPFAASPLQHLYLTVLGDSSEVEAFDDWEFGQLDPTSDLEPVPPARLAFDNKSADAVVITFTENISVLPASEYEVIFQKLDPMLSAM